MIEIKDELKGKNAIPKVFVEALRLRDSKKRHSATYSCHTGSPYGDGYDDSKYGDYSDESRYNDNME